MLLPIHTITQIDLLNTVSLCGQILLPDSFSYSLPANKIVSVNLILRTLRLIEPYDLDKEHDIPAFGDSLFIWEFRNSNISQKQEAERIRIENEARKEYNTSTSGVTGSRINISFDGYTTRNNDKYIVENYPDAADIELTRTYRCKAITVVTVQYLVAGTVYDREITYETEIDYQDVFVSVIYSE